MDRVKKTLLIMVLVLQSKPLLCTYSQPLSILQKGYGLVTGLLLGSVTGVTSAILDYKSTGKSAPVTWSLSQYSRYALGNMVIGSENDQLKSYASKVGEYSAWITYGAALLFLNKNPIHMMTGKL